MKGSGATPLTTQDLFFRDELSIPTALTKTSLILLSLVDYFRFARDSPTASKAGGNGFAGP